MTISRFLVALSVTSFFAVTAAGCASRASSVSGSHSGGGRPQLTGAFAGWSVDWIRQERESFVPRRDFEYALRRDGNRWMIVDRGAGWAPGIERVWVDAANLRIILQARPYAKPRHDLSLCTFGAATSKAETESQNRTYNHCSTAFAQCATMRVGAPGLLHVCYVDLDKGALIAAINEARLEERYRIDAVAAKERAAKAHADAVKAERDRVARRQALTYRVRVALGVLDVYSTIVVDEFREFTTYRSSPPELAVSVQVVNTGRHPVEVALHPILSVSTANGSTYALRAMPRIGENPSPWANECAPPQQAPLVNPGQRCGYSSRFLLPGTLRPDDLARGGTAEIRSVELFGAWVNVSPPEPDARHKND